MGKNIDVVVDYRNGAYNVLGLTDDNKNSTINKPIRGIDKDGLMKASFSRDVENKRRNEVRRYLARIIRENPDTEFSTKAVKDVDLLLFKALQDWDDLNKTRYSMEYLKTVTEVYNEEDIKRQYGTSYKEGCKLARQEKLENLGISVKYDLGFVGTRGNLTLLDKIKGMLIARKQKSVIGAEVEQHFKLEKENSSYLAARDKYRELEDNTISEGVDENLKSSKIQQIREEQENKINSDPELPNLGRIRPSANPEGHDFKEEINEKLNGNTPKKVSVKKVVKKQEKVEEQKNYKNVKVIKARKVEKVEEQVPENTTSERRMTEEEYNEILEIERRRKEEEAKKARLEQERIEAERKAEEEAKIKAEEARREADEKANQVAKEAAMDVAMEEGLREGKPEHEEPIRVGKPTETLGELDEDDKAWETLKGWDPEEAWKKKENERPVSGFGPVKEETQKPVEPEKVEPEVVEPEVAKPQDENKKAPYSTNTPKKKAKKPHIRDTRETHYERNMRLNSEQKPKTQKIRELHEARMAKIEEEKALETQRKIEEFQKAKKLEAEKLAKQQEELAKEQEKLNEEFDVRDVIDLERARNEVLAEHERLNQKSNNVQYDIQEEPAQEENKNSEVISDSKFKRRVKAEVRHWTRKIRDAKDRIQNKVAKLNENTVKRVKQAIAVGAVLGVVVLGLASSRGFGIKNNKIPETYITNSPSYTTVMEVDSKAPSTDVSQKEEETTVNEETKTPETTVKEDGQTPTAPVTEENKEQETPKQDEVQKEEEKAPEDKNEVVDVKSDKEKLEEFKEFAVKKYKTSIAIGQKPGNLLEGEKYYESPNGTGKSGTFTSDKDYVVSHILIITDSGWHTENTPGESLPDIIARYEANGETVRDYSIHFVMADKYEEGEIRKGYGFVPGSNLEEKINNQVKKIIDDKGGEKAVIDRINELREEGR